MPVVGRTTKYGIHPVSAFRGSGMPVIDKQRGAVWCSQNIVLAIFSAGVSESDVCKGRAVYIKIINGNGFLCAIKRYAIIVRCYAGIGYGSVVIVIGWHRRVIAAIVRWHRSHIAAIIWRYGRDVIVMSVIPSVIFYTNRHTRSQCRDTTGDPSPVVILLS